MIVKNIIFDLDNTLYSPTSAMDAGISRRMMAAVVDFLGTDLEAATELRHKNVPYYSTTLEWLRSRGLTDVEGYFAKVHPDNEADELAYDKDLRSFLQSIEQKKIVLTNAPREHADRVLEKLRIADLFSAVVDIRACGLLGKPYANSYKIALEKCGGTIDDTIFLDDQYKYTDGFEALGGTALLVGNKNGAHLNPESAAYNKDVPPHPGRTIKIESVYDLPKILSAL
ncbi:MAG: HAD-IA family hydrolase [Treponema sp.]|nr:HAD-IA family hydrolase [Treponema sp.]